MFHNCCHAAGGRHADGDTPERGNQPIIRGRGGYRPAIPAGITQTVGSGGRDIKLFANYFRIATKGKLTVYDYRVDFAPEGVCNIST